MAFCSSLLSSKLPFIKLFLLLATVMRGGVGQSYTSVFIFGDSVADAGNIFFLDPTFHSLFPPYGESFFHHPTGRCCNGRTYIPYISSLFMFLIYNLLQWAAESLGLPLVRPYLGVNNTSNIEEGVNFAVVGATALDAAFFEERGIDNLLTNCSLRVQLDWFKQILPSLCNTSSKCNETFERSLFLMGEIGGNDYNYPFFLLRSIEEIQTFVPLVIKAMASAIKELIDLGAVTFMVPGTIPFGCTPPYLTYYETADKEEYDPETGCLTWLNKFSEYHNEELQKELTRIQALYPHTTIIYADYYNAAMRLYRSPTQYGFTGGTLAACCGGGGPYNYNASAECGQSPLIRACDDPSQYVSWDGSHFTEAAYRLITNAILEETYIHHSSS